jgi:uncharacterized protein (DUF488 family)
MSRIPAAGGMQAVTLPDLHTIGYAGAAIEALIATLAQAGVTRVLDVRESPFSKRDAFSTDALRAALADYGIAYTHIRALGNPPAGREAARAGHAAAFREIFSAHLDGRSGRAGLEQALRLATAESVCLLCLEKSPLHCHRSMVAARLNALSGQAIVNLRIERRNAHPAQNAFEF